MAIWPLDSPEVAAAEFPVWLHQPAPLTTQIRLSVLPQWNSYSTVSPPFVANHCVRSYLFGRELATAKGLRRDVEYDDELVFLSCILHDNGDQRFEVDGADAAAQFLRTGSVPNRPSLSWASPLISWASTSTSSNGLRRTSARILAAARPRLRVGRQHRPASAQQSAQRTTVELPGASARVVLLNAGGHVV